MFGRSMRLLAMVIQGQQDSKTAGEGEGRREKVLVNKRTGESQKEGLPSTKLSEKRDGVFLMAEMFQTSGLRCCRCRCRERMITVNLGTSRADIFRFS